MAAEELLAVRRQEVVGRSFGELFADAEVWKRTLIGSQLQHTEVDLRKAGRGQTAKILIVCLACFLTNSIGGCILAGSGLLSSSRWSSRPFKPCSTR